MDKKWFYISMFYLTIIIIAFDVADILQNSQN